MDKQLEADIREFWGKLENTKAELAVFAAGLNPPVTISVDFNTMTMVSVLITHCEVNSIELIPNEGTEEHPDYVPGFHQAANVVPVEGDGGDETATQVQPEDEGNLPVADDGAEAEPLNEGIPTPEEQQEEPARDAPYDFGHPDPGAVGAGAPVTAEHPGPEPETFDDLEDVFNAMEVLMKLPPAHQNVITGAQRAMHGKFSELLGEARRLIS